MRTLTTLFLAAALLSVSPLVSDTVFSVSDTGFALRPEYAESTVGLEELSQALGISNDFSKPPGYLVEWPPGLFLENEDGSPNYLWSEYPSLLQGRDELTNPDGRSIYRLTDEKLYRIDAQTGHVKPEGPSDVVRFALHVDGQFLFVEQAFDIAGDSPGGMALESKFLRLDPLTLGPLAAGSLDYWVPAGEKVAIHWDIITAEFVALKLTYSSWDDRKVKGTREERRYLRFVPAEKLWDHFITRTSAYTHFNETIFFILKKELRALPKEPFSFAQQFQDRFKVPARVVLNRLSEERYSVSRLWQERWFDPLLSYFDPIKNLPISAGESSPSIELLPRPAGEAASPDAVTLPRSAEGPSSDTGLEEKEEAVEQPGGYLVEVARGPRVNRMWLSINGDFLCARRNLFGLSRGGPLLRLDPGTLKILARAPSKWPIDISDFAFDFGVYHPDFEFILSEAGSSANLNLPIPIVGRETQLPKGIISPSPESQMLYTWAALPRSMVKERVFAPPKPYQNYGKEYQPIRLEYVPVTEIWNQFLKGDNRHSENQLGQILTQELEVILKQPSGFEMFQRRFQLDPQDVLTQLRLLLSTRRVESSPQQRWAKQLIRYFDPIADLPVPAGPPAPSTETLPRPVGETKSPDTATLPQSADEPSSDAGLEEGEGKKGPSMGRRGFLGLGGRAAAGAATSLGNPAPQAVSASEILAKDPDVAQLYYQVAGSLAKMKETLAGPSSDTQNLFILVNRWRLGELASAWHRWQEKASELAEKEEWRPVFDAMRSFEEEYRRSVTSYGDGIPDPRLAERVTKILGSTITGTSETFLSGLIHEIQGHLLDRNRRYLEEAAAECTRFGTRLDLEERLSNLAYADASRGVNYVLDSGVTFNARDAEYSRGVEEYFLRREHDLRDFIGEETRWILHERYTKILLGAVRKASERNFPPSQDPNEIRLGPDLGEMALYPFESFRERPQGFGMRVFFSEMKRHLYGLISGWKMPSDQTQEERELAHVIQELPPRVLIRTRNPSGLLTEIEHWLRSRPRPLTSHRANQQVPPESRSKEPSPLPEGALGDQGSEGPLPFLWPGKGTHLLQEKFLLFAPEGWSEAVQGLFTEEQRELVQVEPLERVGDSSPDSPAIILLDADVAPVDLSAPHPLVLRLHLGELTSLTPDLLSYFANQEKLRDRVLIWTANSARPVAWEGREYLLLWESA